MATIIEGCPVCGSKPKAHLEATGGEWVGLIMTGFGSVRPCVCLNCGTIYVSRDDIKKGLDAQKRWRVKDGK